MESIVRDTLLHYFETQDLLTSCQHGFRKGKSCLTNLLETLESWTRLLDEGYRIDVICLDYKKAFDTVSHRKLIAKLKYYGVTGANVKLDCGVPERQNYESRSSREFFRVGRSLEWCPSGISFRTVAIPHIGTSAFYSRQYFIQY